MPDLTPEQLVDYKEEVRNLITQIGDILLDQRASVALDALLSSTLAVITEVEDEDLQDGTIYMFQQGLASGMQQLRNSDSES